MKLVDMSPALQARVRASIAKEAARTRARPSDAPAVTLGGKKRPSKANTSGPNATEAQACRHQSPTPPHTPRQGTPSVSRCDTPVCDIVKI